MTSIAICATEKQDCHLCQGGLGALGQLKACSQGKVEVVRSDKELLLNGKILGQGIVLSAK
jgi:hypothetical protein